MEQISAMKALGAMPTRTIVDLSENKKIKIEHLSEAIKYRSLDRSFLNPIRNCFNG